MLGGLCRMLVAALMFWVLPAEAVTFTPIYQFNGGASDGAFPVASLIADPSTGILYGTTAGGGGTTCKVGCGTVFSIDPTTGTETVLYSFQGPPTDGAVPVAGLLMDQSGNLYGTTSQGGNGVTCNGYGCGTVFKLAPVSKRPGASSTWNYTILYQFKGGSDGQDPRAPLIQDPSSGILYGTAAEGGVADCGYFRIGCGTIFSITTDGSTEATLYSFGGTPDGENPRAALTRDNAGNLYGTTMSGGGTTNSSMCVYESCGTVFELAKGGSETVLYSFQGGESDGANPVSSVILDNNGNLDGATLYGGSSDCFGYGCGTVFQLLSTGGKNLYPFSPVQGEAPVAALIEDSSGLYLDGVACGEACNGGRPGKNNCGKGCHWGIVYQLQTNARLEPSISTLFTFDNTNGSAPSAPLLLSGSTLYGTTQNGGLLKKCPGKLGCGTVFSISLNRN